MKGKKNFSKKKKESREIFNSYKSCLIYTALLTSASIICTWFSSRKIKKETKEKVKKILTITYNIRRILCPKHQKNWLKLLAG